MIVMVKNYIKNDSGRISSGEYPCEEETEHASPLLDTFLNLDRNPTYFNEASDSCYWFNSKGLNLYLSGKNDMLGTLSSDFIEMMDLIFESIYFNEKVNTSWFSEKLLSRLREVLEIENDCSGGITIFLGWKSVALIILAAGRNSEMGEIEVTIGTSDYRILC
ncbi:hypothetical protein [Methanolobus sp.]|uniref:hypothetical protein n=1 Tax=Methanolobus sp. TaxID=1874737 RepID=UPI0025D5C3C4|nr:hypothetical protein [Methanolobus sp.]